MRLISTSLLVGVLLLLSCLMQLGCEASGRMDRVSSHRLAPQPADEVELYFDNRAADRPYHLIAHVESEAGTRRFVTVHEAEAAALDKLRSLAARAGARAVIDIERSITRDDETDERVVRASGKAVIFRR